MDSRLGLESMVNRLKQTSSLSDSVVMPEAKHQDYLSQFRKQYGVGTNAFPNMMGNTSSVSSNKHWGNARASSYWDQQTASGKPMSNTTIASPYLPLGTMVEIMKNGKKVRGTVQDFGPADWVMKGDPDRFLDLAEPMMAQLTGNRSDLTGVQYKVLKYGSGRVYRPNSSVTRKLKKLWG